MTDKESETRSPDETSEFNFDNWCKDAGLSRKVSQILRQEELTTRRSLELLESSDLKELGLPLGAVKVILEQIKVWKCVRTDNAHSENEVNSPGSEINEDLTGAVTGAQSQFQHQSINLPRQHGNWHADAQRAAHQSGIGTHLHRDVHANLSVQHDNNRQHPAIHGNFNANQWFHSPVQRLPESRDFHHNQHISQETHVDHPGQHGNLSPFPVVHRVRSGPHAASQSLHVPHSHHTGGETHIDHPGQHGNLSPYPVVHRVESHGGTSDSHDAHPGHSETHIDQPGQHGNLSPHPVVHRVGSHGGTSETHIDHPGQHGNVSPYPVVHRVGSHGGTGETHIDHPGQHGNLSPHPVVHRVGSHRGTSASHDAHPGHHGNLLPAPVIHRGFPNGHGGGRHVLTSGQHPGQLETSVPVAVPREFGENGIQTGTAPIVPPFLMRPLSHGPLPFRAMPPLSNTHTPHGAFLMDQEVRRRMRRRFRVIRRMRQLVNMNNVLTNVIAALLQG